MKVIYLFLILHPYVCVMQKVVVCSEFTSTLTIKENMANI
jgi:hypothetical protein